MSAAEPVSVPAPAHATIEIVANAAEGLLPRIVGVVEARQWRLVSLIFHAEGTHARATLTVQPIAPGRSPETLSRQLARLVQVQSVTCDPKDEDKNAEA